MAEVFLTEEEAVKLMFPKSEHIKKELLRVPTDKKMVVEERIGWKFPEDAFDVYIGETGTQSTATPSCRIPSANTNP